MAVPNVSATGTRRHANGRNMLAAKHLRAMQDVSVGPAEKKEFAPGRCEKSTKCFTFDTLRRFARVMHVSLRFHLLCRRRKGELNIESPKLLTSKVGYARSSGL